MIRACLIVAIAISGCTDLLPNKLLVGGNHTSHLLSHFEHEPGGTVGCTGPMVGLRWQQPIWYVQASETYCEIGINDQQHEVSNLQAALEIPLR